MDTLGQRAVPSTWRKRSRCFAGSLAAVLAPERPSSTGAGLSSPDGSTAGRSASCCSELSRELYRDPMRATVASPRIRLPIQYGGLTRLWQRAERLADEAPWTDDLTLLAFEQLGEAAPGASSLALRTGPSAASSLLRAQGAPGAGCWATRWLRWPAASVLWRKSTGVTTLPMLLPRRPGARCCCGRHAGQDGFAGGPRRWPTVTTAAARGSGGIPVRQHA